MKIVINRCFGGFGLSDAAMYAYAERKGLTLYPEKTCTLFTTYWTVPPEQRPQEIDWVSSTQEERAANNKAVSDAKLYDREIPRNDPDLVAVVEQLGDTASDKYAQLRVVEIPDDVEWKIDEYDGSEHIAEVHRTWC
jgi:hypothetical protein